MTTRDKKFSIVARSKSFSHALRGIWVALNTTPNAWIQIAILFIVIAAGFWFKIVAYEWISIILSAGMVLAAEAFNTAIEIDIDLTSPEYHPFARDTKDVAAGAVLLASLAAALVGLVIFVPHIFLYL